MAGGGGDTNRMEVQAYRARFDTVSPDVDSDWIEPLNTPWTQRIDENFRLRMSVLRRDVTGTFSTLLKW